MAEAFQFGYGNPANFSDWVAYAGLDRKSGTMRSGAQPPGIDPSEEIPDVDMSTGVQAIVPPSISAIPPMGSPAGVMPTSSMGGTASSLGYVMKHFGD